MVSEESLPGALAYEGLVTHHRYKPVTHRLAYKVFCVLFDLDRLDETAARFRWFSRNRFNLFSFHDGDYGAGRPEELAAYIRAVLAEAKIDARARIMLACYPRILGYAFNPLAVYYCYDKEDRLGAMIYEVSNTFGQRHSYLIPIAHKGARIIRQSAQKKFHVSPFIDMDMRYEFAMSAPGDQLSMSIMTIDGEGPLLHAGFRGRARSLNDKSLLGLFFRYPLMTLKVIAGIHLEAAKLLAKGLRLRAGAPTPANPVSFVPPVKTLDDAA